jgi:S1-C subfamily serine protease
MKRLHIILACAIGALALPFDLVMAQNLREVFRRVNPSVAVVRVEPSQSQTVMKPDGQMAQNLGSGFPISQDGKMLTAAHIVKSAERIEVLFLDSPPISARVIAIAPFADLALLQLDHLPANAVIAQLGDSGKMETGDQVFTIGTPYGANHSLSVGWISARRKPDNIYEDMTALEVLAAAFSWTSSVSGIEDCSFNR